MIDTRALYPTMPITPAGRQTSQISTPNSKDTNLFKNILQNEIAEVKFSQHALERIKSRNIQLGSEELTGIKEAVDKAAQKGARESLILMGGNLALVVSVKNRTVITAMDGASMKENVFTNIDSAVII